MELKIRTKEQQMIDAFKKYIKTKGNVTIDYSLEAYMQVALDYISSLEQENQKYKEVIDTLEFIKARAKEGATQETINKLAINFVNSFIKRFDK